MKKLFLYIFFGALAQLAIGISFALLGVKEYYVGAWSQFTYFAVALYPFYKNHINSN